MNTARKCLLIALAAFGTFQAAGFYDPNLQKWPNRDPIQERAGLNLYRFVWNAPLSFVDPKGLQDAAYEYSGTPGGDLTLHDLTQLFQNYTPFGGRCKNTSKKTEWALVDGAWRELKPGDSTGMFEDCDGMTCNGGFYAVYRANGECNGKNDCGDWNTRRWTPTRDRHFQGRDAQPPAWEATRRGRGSLQGNTPPGYVYSAE